VLHTSPQAPQCDSLVDVSMHPAPAAEQSIVPGGHDTTQPPAEHRVPVEQARPHAPQLRLSLRTFTQAPAQSDAPAGQRHTPLEHVCPPTHARPHAPQLALSAVRFTHVPAQSVCPEGHTHAPVTHDCPPEHARPHAPQFVFVAMRLVSQPFAGFASQLPKPALHAPSAHAPAAQAPAALANTQGRPHIPQWFESVAKVTSQPLITLASQLPNPAAQTIDTQAPPAQIGTPLTRLHARPHAPQLRASVLSADSHPFAARPSQSPRPGAQSTPTVHALATHAAVRPAGAVQTLPHRPQADASERVSVSHPFATTPSQSAKPVRHTPSWHVPSTQRSAAFARSHRRPQTPQWSIEVDVAVSHPASVVQSPRPTMHAVCTHTPPTQRENAPGQEPSHERPQAPQLASSREVSTHAPLQSDCPAGHTQAPPTHDWPGTHVVAQPPQCVVSVNTLTHPTPAQSCCPATGHAQRPPAQL
jgi:hypothetical protein